MSEINFNFESTSAPDDGPPIEPDAITVVSAEHPCKVCGKETTRKGTRGRWPSYCEEHQGAKAVDGGTTITRVGNDKTAEAAANLLARLNYLIATGLMFYLPMTSAELTSANDEFKKIAYEALASDPKLARKILSAGGKSAGFGLTLAYGSLAVAIAPSAMKEIKEKRNGD